jgi:DNA polymerase III subunit chi
VPQIDFYILADSNPGARFGIACRVIEKAARQTTRVLVRTRSESEARTLDELLWTFSDVSFVPHRLLPDGRADETSAGDEPVLITHSASTVSDCDVLVNLTDTIPESAAQYPRIVEIVTNASDDRQAGRVRYRDYRALGFELNVHNL